MSDPTTLSDEQYEEDVREADNEFLRERTEWTKLFTEELERLPLPQTDGSAISAQVMAEVEAVMRGEPLSLDWRPPVKENLITKLAKASRNFARSALKGYSSLLCRKGIPYSQVLNLLEQHATALLEETRTRKWNPAIQNIAELFDCESSAEDSWRLLVERVTWGFVREILEPQVRGRG